MPDNTVTLTVGGTIYGGWKSVGIVRSIETVAGSFTLTATEIWPGQPERRRIRTGDACKLAIGGETVITGYVDAVQPSYDKASHIVEITGRDATGDLVDCTALWPPNSWTGLKLEAIAAILCKPFGIKVRADVDTGRPLNFALNPPETVFEAIERMCRYRAVLPVSDSRGGLVFTRGGTARKGTALVLGENVLKARGDFSDMQRFSDYYVGSQLIGAELWKVPPGHATDPSVRRYRPLAALTDLPEGQTFSDRARWEANVRAGRARRAQYTVQGWRDGAGALWQPNSIVEVSDPWVAVSGAMLIASVGFTLDDNGSRTELGICRPEAFQLIAMAQEPGEGLWHSAP